VVVLVLVEEGSGSGEWGVGLANVDGERKLDFVFGDYASQPEGRAFLAEKERVSLLGEARLVSYVRIDGARFEDADSVRCQRRGAFDERRELRVVGNSKHAGSIVRGSRETCDA
jgi:hypothetical protein